MGEIIKKALRFAWNKTSDSALKTFISFMGVWAILLLIKYNEGINSAVREWAYVKLTDATQGDLTFLLIFVLLLKRLFRI